MGDIVTDSERREVAARMRELDVSVFRDSAIVPFLDCLGAGYMGWRGVLDALADLIDRPACENVSGCGDVFVCGECRARIELIGEMGNEHGEVFSVPFQPRYCPSCGAEVAR